MYLVKSIKCNINYIALPLGTNCIVDMISQETRTSSYIVFNYNVGKKTLIIPYFKNACYYIFYQHRIMSLNLIVVESKVKFLAHSEDIIQFQDKIEQLQVIDVCAFMSWCLWSPNWNPYLAPFPNLLKKKYIELILLKYYSIRLFFF